MNLHDIPLPSERPLYDSWRSDEDKQQTRDALDHFHSQVLQHSNGDIPSDASPHQTKEHWVNHMRKALSRGDVTPEHAESMGLHNGGGYGIDTPSESGRGGWRPLPEKLYHVTNATDKIQKEGLKTPDELGQKNGTGLGGGNSMGSISTTTDHKLANDIYQGMHEYHAVLNGKKTIDDMVHESKNPQSGGAFGATRDMSRDWMPGHFDAMRRGKVHSEMYGDNHPKMMSAEQAKESHPGWSPIKDSAMRVHNQDGTSTPVVDQKGNQIYHHFERNATEDEKIDHRNEVYKSFARQRHFAGGARDPLFISNDHKAFAKSDPNQISILHVTPKPGANGYPISHNGEHHKYADSGEWRTHSGEGLQVQGAEWPKVERVANHAQGLQREAGYNYFRDFELSKEAMMPSPGKGPLPIEPGKTWYRLHYKPRKWSQENASSAPLGSYWNYGGKAFDEDQRQHGYSAFDNPHELHGYLQEHGWYDQAAQSEHNHVVTQFKGTQDSTDLPSGTRKHTGRDGEPLVTPGARADRVEMPIDEFHRRLQETPQEHEPGGYNEKHQQARQEAVKPILDHMKEAHPSFAENNLESESPERISMVHGLAHHHLEETKKTVDGIENMPDDAKAQWDKIYHAPHQFPGQATEFMPKTSVWRPNDRMFAPGKQTLDPKLFDDDEKMLPEVRQTILGMIDSLWGKKYGDWQQWSRVYLAGSEATYWWSNRDFDTLVGIHYPDFKRLNPEFKMMNPQQIADQLNAEFRRYLNQPEWHPPFDPDNTWELTVYNNPNSFDIRNIKPYAAYDITGNMWIVRPPDAKEDWGPDKFPHEDWKYVDDAVRTAKEILALPEPARSIRAQAYWEYLHTDRKRGFGPYGTGYTDRANVVYKALDMHPDGLLKGLLDARKSAPLNKHASAEGDEYAPTFTKVKLHHPEVGEYEKTRQVPRHTTTGEPPERAYRWAHNEQVSGYQSNGNIPRGTFFSIGKPDNRYRASNHKLISVPYKDQHFRSSVNLHGDHYLTSEADIPVESMQTH